MKVIKRNGSEMEFTPEKIIAAIGKANVAAGGVLSASQIETTARNVCDQLSLIHI